MFDVFERMRLVWDFRWLVLTSSTTEEYGPHCEVLCSIKRDEIKNVVNILL